MNTILTQWQTGIGEVQFLLAIGLFFIINLIGSKSYSIGYIPISLLVKDESKLAFNFAIRVVTPIIYLIITSSFLYYSELDSFVDNFYLVSIYYILFRYFINALQGRLLLLNWGRQFIYSFSIVLLSYFFYMKFIRIKQNLLPDFNNIANEVWIIIILFVYKIVNELDVSLEGSEIRKGKYIKSKFIELRFKYGKIIDARIDNDVLKSIIYAIIIYENFNRSKLVRSIENASFFLTKKPHTLGIMQVTTSEYITDETSVILGIRKIKDDYANYLIESQLKVGGWHGEDNDDEQAQYYRTMLARNEIISKYNIGQDYLEEVGGISEQILSKYYSKTSSVLDPIVRNS